MKTEKADMPLNYDFLFQPENSSILGLLPAHKKQEIEKDIIGNFNNMIDDLYK